MPIPVQCGECFETYRVRDELIGKRVRCKSCGKPISVRRPSSETSALLDMEDESDEHRLPQPRPRSRRSSGKKNRGSKLADWWSSLDLANQETQAMLLTGAVTSLLVFLTLVAFLDSRASLLLYGAGLYIGLPSVIVVGMFGTALQFEISFFSAALRWIIGLSIGWVVMTIVDHFQLPRGITRSLGMGLYFYFQPTMTASDFRKRFPLYNRCFAISLMILFLPLTHALYGLATQDQHSMDAIENWLSLLGRRR
jgi:hypothetical protein